MKLRDAGERSLVRSVSERIRMFGEVGPGDDAAVIEVGDEHLAVCTDSLTFERHMPPGMSYEQFGWMSAAVNFSDIASMGARPVGILVSLLLPAELEDSSLFEIMDGIESCAEHYGAFILGGDTKPGEGAVSCTALGIMEGRKPMTRSGAKEGDVVAVTGSLGSAAAGYYAIQHGIKDDSILSLMVPLARVDFGTILSKIGATSCMDISDGLSVTANEICSKSGVGMDILWESIPVGVGVEKMSEFASKEHIMMDFGGDYELLFTFPKEKLEELHNTDVDFTVIGMVNDSGRPYLLKDGNRMAVDPNGYEHFKD